jgi:hypothetical protein
LRSFFDGDGFLVERRVSWVQGSNDLVNGVEEDTAGNAVTTGVALNEVAKIVNIYIDISQGERVWLAAGYTNHGTWCRLLWHNRKRDRCASR